MNEKKNPKSIAKLKFMQKMSVTQLFDITSYCECTPFCSINRYVEQSSTDK